MTQRREMAAPWFGSRTLALHLLRGVFGVGSFVSGIWLAATGFNMWVGVSRAGSSIAEELPIFLLLFAIPTILALVVKWKFL